VLNSSRAGYVLGRPLLPTFGELPLVRIDLMAVRTWLAELHDAGEVNASTIAKAYRLLGRILGAAVEAGYLPASPCIVKGTGSSMRKRPPDQRWNL
jgi:hypothetical protein